jgi:hypothetical protein
MRKEEARAGVARPGSVSSSGIAAAGPSGKAGILGVPGCLGRSCSSRPRLDSGERPPGARAAWPWRAAARSEGVGLHEAGVGFCAGLGWAGAGARGRPFPQQPPSRFSERFRSPPRLASREGEGAVPGAGRREFRRLSPNDPLQPGEKPLPEMLPGRTLRAGGGRAQGRRPGGPGGTTPRDAFRRPPPRYPRQGVGEGGASAGRSTIGYRVAVKPRLANRIRGEPCSPSGSVSEPAERSVCA